MLNSELIKAKYPRFILVSIELVKKLQGLVTSTLEMSPIFILWAVLLFIKMLPIAFADYHLPFHV